MNPLRGAHPRIAHKPPNAARRTASPPRWPTPRSAARASRSRFPAATGGYFDTGGDPDRLEKDTFLGKLTRQDGDGPTRGLVYDGGATWIEKVLTGLGLDKLTAGQETFANIGINGKGLSSALSRLRAFYKQRPLWILKVSTLWCSSPTSALPSRAPNGLVLQPIPFFTFMAVLTFERGGRSKTRRA